MVHNMLGTPQNRKSRIVPGLVEQLNRECSEAEKQGKVESQSLEQKTAKIIVSDIKDICRGYEEFMGWENKVTEIPTQITDEYSPTKQQILGFSKCLINYKNLRKFNYDSSNYLTALMHSSEEKEFEIDLQELNKNNILLNSLGYKLENKILVVNGSVGNLVGDDMKNSKIIINGSAGNFVGDCAENCEITINGNVGSRVGLNAKNSKITINGSAEDWVGSYAKNCEISVRDSIGSISNHVFGSKIFQFKNNKWVEVKG